VTDEHRASDKREADGESRRRGEETRCVISALPRQGLRIIDLTTRLNDFAVTVSPDHLSPLSPDVTIAREF